MKNRLRFHVGARNSVQHLQRYAGVSQTAEPRKRPLLSGILDVGLGKDFLLRSREGQSEDIVTECASGLLVRFLVFYFILFYFLFPSEIMYISSNKAISETIAWLDQSQEASKEEYEEKQKELESVANPIMQRLYGAAGGPGGGFPGGPGGFPGGAGGFPGGAPGGFPGADEGPSVEEVD